MRTASCWADRSWRRLVPPAAAAVLGVLALAGCDVADADSTTIEMHDGNRFSPSTVRVPAGSSVVWSNVSGEPHTVSTEEGAAPGVRTPDGVEPWASDLIDPGDTYARRFDEPGVYVFACELHGDDGMIGVVSVGR